MKEPGSRMMLGVAVLWSISSNVDKIAVKNSNPLMFSLLFSVSVWAALSLVLLVKRISLVRIFKNAKILAPIGLASGSSHAFQMLAINLTIVPNVIAVKRTGVLFGSVWGKLFFKEEKFRERLLGAAIMVLGVVLITIS